MTEDKKWGKDPKRRRRYYEANSERKVSPLLLEALQLGEFKTALELGCGAGVDAKEIAGQGIKLTAVDINPEVKEFLKDTSNINVIISSFEEFDFGKYDVIYSSGSLPFMKRSDFFNVLEKIKEALYPGGVFAARFWGANDDWNKPGREDGATFATVEEIKEVFKDLEEVKFEEKEKDGKTALGKQKHWHIIDVIYR